MGRATRQADDRPTDRVNEINSFAFVYSFILREGVFSFYGFTILFYVLFYLIVYSLFL